MANTVAVYILEEGKMPAELKDLATALGISPAPPRGWLDLDVLKKIQSIDEGIAESMRTRSSITQTQVMTLLSKVAHGRQPTARDAYRTPFYIAIGVAFLLLLIVLFLIFRKN